jgi:hypothetical protein
MGIGTEREREGLRELETPMAWDFPCIITIILTYSER